MRSRSKQKDIIFRVIALIIGIVLSYAMLETAARVILWKQGEYIDTLRAAGSQHPQMELTLFDIVRPAADPRRVYELVPDLNGRFAKKPLRTNDQGFRDDDFETSKPKRVTRIAILGDSVAFGWGVEEKERFGSLLPKLMAENSGTSAGTGRKIQVYNFAVPGYNTAMELATWKDVASHYKPDILVLSLVGNDTDLPNFVRIKPKLWSLRKSFILQAIRDQFRGRKIGDTARVVIGGLVPSSPDTPKDEIPAEYRDLQGKAAMKSALAQLLKECRLNHIRPMCVVQCRIDKPTAEAMAVNQDPDLAKIAGETGWPVCDPTQEIVKELDRQKIPANALWVTKNDMHPNAKAHEIIAKKLAESLNR